MRLQRAERAFLVGAHEPAVAHDIGGENGRQPAFPAFFDHSVAVIGTGGGRGQSLAFRPDCLSVLRRPGPDIGARFWSL